MFPQLAQFTDLSLLLLLLLLLRLRRKWLSCSEL